MNCRAFIKLYLTTSLLGLFMVTGLPFSSQAQSLPDSKRQAEPFILPTWDGKVIKSSQLKGQVVLLQFFQTGCPDCQEEAPGLEHLYRKFRKKGFSIIGISHDREGAPAVATFVKKYGLTYPIVLGDLSIAVNYIGITPTNPSFRIPYLILIDRHGFIAGRYEEGKAKEATDLKLLETLIKKRL